jgi:hypothetical protein
MVVEVRASSESFTNSTVKVGHSVKKGEDRGHGQRRARVRITVCHA